MKKAIFIATAMLFSAQALAVYNANIGGQLAEVWTYTDSDSVYLKLKNQPASHPSCNPSYFVIDSSVSPDRRKALFSRLLAAYASNAAINVGYDNAGNCAEGYIRVHAVGG